MTTKALKCRILEHFRRPNSDFDRTHTFEDVSEIYALCVHAKSHVSIDEVEADCIATLGPNLVCNNTAASPRLMEQLLCQPDLSSEMAERIIQSNLVHASTYSPGAFLLPDEKVAEVASGASDSKERCRRDSKESVPRGVKREDINDYIVEHHGLITQSEMARELGITTKAVERRVSRLRKAGRIPPRDTTR